VKWKRELKVFSHAVRECKRRQQSATDELKAINLDEDKALREELKATLGGFKGAPPPGGPAPPSPSPDTRTLTEPVPQFPQFVGRPRSANFIGRIEQLEALEVKLEVGDQSPERKLRAVVIHGLGGMGKTYLANEFAHRHRAKFDACYWVPSDTTVKLAQGFEAIARRLQIDETDDAQVRASVIDWLCKTGVSKGSRGSETNRDYLLTKCLSLSCLCLDKTWLLIFDNAEEPESLMGYFPTDSSGSIIITSRSRHWIYYDYVHVLSLAAFTLEDGVALLQSKMERHDRSIPVQLAEDIVREAGGLPLAINQIGSYIATTHASPREFLVKYQEKEGEAQRIHSYAIPPTDLQPQNLATVWDITLQKLTPAATFVLTAMVILDPDAIPVDVFANGLASGSFMPHISTTEE
jgi:hypothetical protein